MSHQKLNSRPGSATSTLSYGLFKGLIMLGAASLVGEIVRRRRRMDLAGKNVFITGGSRGLGLALAREFALRDADLFLCARNPRELADAADDLRRYGVNVETFVCDLREPHQIRSVVELIERNHRGIDVLVNNAGSISVGPLESMTHEDFQEAMDVNFWSAYHTTTAVLPGMRARSGGRIVNIASIGGILPVPHLAPYCASKFACVGYSESLRLELAKDGVLVTTVNPGLMRTGSPRNALFKGNPRAEYAWFSIGDSLPGLSISAPTAARRIVDAAAYGEAYVVVGLPAKVAAKVHALAPTLTLELTSLATRLFPRRAAQEPRRGRDSESWITRSAVRTLGHKAERQLNQL